MEPGHFSFITQAKDGKFELAEVVSYSSLDRLMGKTYRFKCEIRDGVWIHSGSEDHLLIEEHWKPAK